MKNPTLVIPIKSKKQLGHLFKAQGELAKAGVTFDSGTRMIKPMQRHWELDWSLKGASMRNPKAVWHANRIKELAKLQASGRDYTRYTAMLAEEELAAIASGLSERTILNLKRAAEFENPKDRKPRIVWHPRVTKRNPSKKSEVGGVLTGFSLMLLFPIIMGLVFWFESRKKE